jgi:hypothetical protein
MNTRLPAFVKSRTNSKLAPRMLAWKGVSAVELPTVSSMSNRESTTPMLIRFCEYRPALAGLASEDAGAGLFVFVEAKAANGDFQFLE